MCASLLTKPGLGDFQKAGAHYILAHSPEDYVFHAQEALRLYKGLPDYTEEMREARDKWIANAEKALQVPLEDDANLTYEEVDDVVEKMIDKEYHDRIQAIVDSLQEQYDEQFDKEEIEFELNDYFEWVPVSEESTQHESVSDSESNNEIGDIGNGSGERVTDLEVGMATINLCSRCTSPL
ncbi:uncharacterized protein SPSK_08037 [Sporothrix schenckii 1099-18]|uniref:Uncharacterized protein n=1 Tax=Sporothrix schenckii 1099-18 TaxID=1397361 RepID=A0A0F2MIY0_SPOSC|nr:uncharacterized protein SPSK_08037 [Sporothrix schenckii 1099-18]KJR89009.1 hypothetical protein SPSK_08037 [Sporothrix schenckii 1099-18]